MKVISLESVNLVIVLIIIIIILMSFLLYSLHLIKSKSCQQAFYERSHHLLLLAYLTSFIQSILNIFYDELFIEHSENNSKIRFYYQSIISFSSRFYAILMCLRMLRMSALHRLRYGKLQPKFRIVLKLKFNLFISFIYS